MASDVTRILKAIDEGDARASSELLPLVYGELRVLADQRLARERRGHSLQATALVHEAYIRLVEADGAGWNGRGHFFGAAAEAMRRLLIDRARARGADKRGGSGRRLDIDLTAISLEDVPPEVVDVSDALDRLASEDQQKAELVKLRFFAGLTIAQAAAVLGVSEATANRHWAFARAWLYDDLRRNS